MDGRSVGAVTAHVDDNAGCEEPHALSSAQQFLECCLGMLKIRETSFGFVGMRPRQDFNFSFAAAQKVLMYEMELVSTTPTTQVERQSALLMDDAKLPLRRLPTASYRAFRARLGAPTAKVNAPRRGDTVCITDVIEKAKRWPSQTSLKYKADACLAGWPNPAYLVQTREGRRPLGDSIALILSPSRGVCHWADRSSRFIRRTAKGSLGGDIHALRGPN